MSEPGNWILYGANGYTGQLIARHAVERGLRPVLAGRNREAIERLASELGCRCKILSLHAPERIARELAGAAAVLHCAGPSSQTAVPMIEACMLSGSHYLDITGEIGVIEAAAARDPSAAKAGVALIPAVGFDVVPSDCLAAMLADRLPGAKLLQLAFSSSGGISPGTAKTALEALADGGAVRQDGKIRRVPLAYKTMEVPFRDRTRLAISIAWGDVASAYYSTGIGNIEVYQAARAERIAQMRRLRMLKPLLKLGFVRRFAQRRIERRVSGPTAQQRHAARSSFWGRVSDEQGRFTSATMLAPSGYELTTLTAVAALEKVLDGQVRNGFSTPSLAFGKEFILGFPGIDFRWENNEGGRGKAEGGE